MTEQERFEAWHFKKYYVQDADKSILYESYQGKGKIKYISHEVQHSWVAWQAAQQKEGNDDEFGIVELTQGFKAKCDLSDLDLVNQYKWYPCKQGNNTYALTHSDTRPSVRKSISMHRLIMGAGKNEIIDHINGDSLDNRRCNLRFVTKRENAFNSTSRRGASKYKGVTFRKDTGKWRANIGFDMERKCLGSFATEVEAAAAYNQAAIELHGEHARLNILESNLKTHTYDADKFVLVPVEPNQEMIEAFDNARFMSISLDEGENFSDGYAAMIAAAQEPT